jgi:hypothetical protein
VSVRYIEARTQKDRALQLVIRALGIIRYGGHLTPTEAKTFIDLCSLALPNRYRLTREEWAKIEMGVTQTLIESDIEH